MLKRFEMRREILISALFFSIIIMIGLKYSSLMVNSVVIIFVGVCTIPISYFGIIVSKIVLEKASEFFSIKMLCILIGVFWVGNTVLCYPASSVPFDSFYIIGEFYEFFPKTNNHPYLIVIIMGTMMRLGQTISDNFGIYIYILLQTTIMYGTVLLAVRYMKKWGINDKYIKIMLLIYCFCPLYAIYTTVDRKDVLFSTFVFLYLLFFINSIIGLQKKYKMSNYLCEVSSAILAVLLRHNGIFIILISQVARIFFVKRKGTWKSILSIVAILLAYIITNKYIYMGLGVESITDDRSYACMNANRFQQTARYVIKHEEDLSTRDINIINAMFGSVDNMHLYTPNNGDNIMSLAYREHSKEILSEYNKMWIRHFLNDPIVYISAHLNYVYLYLYPFEIPENSIFEISSGLANTGYFDIYRADFSEKYVGQCERVFSCMSKIPMVNALLSAGLYNWLMIYCIIYAMINKKVYLLVIFSALIAQMFVCIGGFLPVNGALHYAFPIILVSPFMMGIRYICIKD